MDLIVLLRTAEAVVWALVSATPHRTVEGRKLVLVMKTGTGRGRSRLPLRICVGFLSQRRTTMLKASSTTGIPASCDRLQRIVRKRFSSGSGGERFLVSRRRVARLSQRGRRIGEQSIRVNPRTGRRAMRDDPLALVRSFSGRSARNTAALVHPEFLPHGNPDPAWCHIPPSAHALHRAVGRT